MDCDQDYLLPRSYPRSLCCLPAPVGRKITPLLLLGSCCKRYGSLSPCRGCILFFLTLEQKLFTFVHTLLWSFIKVLDSKEARYSALLLAIAGLDR